MCLCVFTVCFVESVCLCVCFYWPDGEIKFSQTDLHAGSYHVVAADLRDLKQLEAKLAECSLDDSLPTAFLAECVLVYLPAENSSAIVRWIAEKFNTAFFINYEQVCSLTTQPVL